MKKCEKCNKRFKVQEWKIDREREVCFTCGVKEKFVKEVLGKLSIKEKTIMEMRLGFLDGKMHTLEEVGKFFGVTRERIRQIEAKAYDKLKNYAELKSHDRK